MKKIVSIALALTMILSIGILASAETKPVDVKVIYDFGDPSCEFSCPSSFELTADNSYMDTESIALTEWKAEVGHAWFVTVENSATATSAGGATVDVQASITGELDSNVNENGIGPYSTTADGQVTVSTSGSGASENIHLAGSETFNGTITFTISYK